MHSSSRFNGMNLLQSCVLKECQRGNWSPLYQLFLQTLSRHKIKEVSVYGRQSYLQHHQIFPQLVRVLFAWPFRTFNLKILNMELSSLTSFSSAMLFLPTLLPKKRLPIELLNQLFAILRNVFEIHAH